MYKFVLVTIGLLLVLAAAVAGQEPQRDLISGFAKISPSVGALYSQEADGGSLRFNCTMTASGKHGAALVMVTAYHCVQKGTSYLVSFDGTRFYPARVWKIPRWEVDKDKIKKSWGEPEVDMALFLVDNGPDIPTIPLGVDTPVLPGQRIVTVGFPLGVTKTRYEGIIAGTLERQNADRDGYLLLQIFGAPGSSGSAVISLQDLQIVGILVAGLQGGAGLPVIFATPAHYLKYLSEVPR